MKQRALPTILIAAAVAVGLAACGSDSESGAGSDVGSTLPPVTDGFAHPTGADEIVIEYAEVGGFVPMEVAFQETPIILVSGDGKLFTPGIVPAIYPGPLVPALQVQTISEAGIQQLLAAAEEAGLFADIDYEQPMQIADASSARVVINVDGETYVHEAYALGLDPDGDESPERQALAGFVEELRTLAAVDAAELGESEVFSADEFGIRAMAIDDLTNYTSDGIEPTVVEWPADAGVALADAEDCVVVSAEAVGETFAESDALTFFDDGGTTYQVLVKPILPGTTCGS